jgi:hypothetical protein
MDLRPAWTLSLNKNGLGYDSVVEKLPSMCEAQGLIPSPSKKEYSYETQEF